MFCLSRILALRQTREKPLKMLRRILVKWSFWAHFLTRREKLMAPATAASETSARVSCRRVRARGGLKSPTAGTWFHFTKVLRERFWDYMDKFCLDPEPVHQAVANLKPQLPPELQGLFEEVKV
jgi:hypothetical protein